MPKTVTLYRNREGILETRKVKVPDNEQPGNTIVGKLKCLGWRTTVEKPKPEPVRRDPVKSVMQFRNGSTMTIVGDKITDIKAVGDPHDETNTFLLRIFEEMMFGQTDGEQTLTQPDEEPVASPESEPVPEPTESS